MSTDDRAADKRTMQDLHRTLLGRMAESERRMEDFRVELMERLSAFELFVANAANIDVGAPVGQSVRQVRPVETSAALRQPSLPGTLMVSSAGPICEATDTEQRDSAPVAWEVHEDGSGLTSPPSPASRGNSSAGLSATKTTPGGKSRKLPSRGPSRLKAHDPGKSPQTEFMERLEGRALRERIERGLTARKLSSNKMDVGQPIQNNRPGFDRMRLQIHHTYSSLSGSAGTPRHRGNLLNRLTRPFHPLDVFSRFWVCVLLVTAYASLISLPFWIGFGTTRSGVTVLSFWMFARMVIYALDIVISFRTAYISEELDTVDGMSPSTFEAGVVAQYSSIAKKYVLTWFIPDLLMLAAAAYSVASAQTRSGTGWFAELIKLPILFKALKLKYNESAIRLGKKASMQLGSGLSRLLAAMAYMSLMIHWVACIFHYIAAVNEFDDSTWVAANGLADADNWERYLQAIYWALTTLTTVGYGDVLPVGIAEKIFTVLTMTLGIGCFAYLLSSMSALAVSLNQRQAKEKEWVAKMESFISRHNISGALASRLLLYQEFLKDRALPGADQEVMENLSDTLRTQVDLYLNATVIQSLPILSCRPNVLLAELVKTFSLTLHAPGDIIMLEGDVSQKMHFICGGFVDVWISTSLFSRRKHNVTEHELSEFVRSKDKHPSPGEVIKGGASISTSKFMKAGELKHGASFGCITCLNGKPRVCSIASTACTEIRVIKLVDLNEILEVAESDIAVDMLELIHDMNNPSFGNAVDDLESSASKSVALHQETAMNLVLKTAEKAHGRMGKMFSAVRGVTKWYRLSSKMADAVQQVKSESFRKGALASLAEEEQVEKDDASSLVEGSSASWTTFALPG